MGGAHCSGRGFRPLFALGLASLHGEEWVGAIPEGLNAVRVTVMNVAMEHSGRIKDFQSWLHREGGIPREPIDRSRIREIFAVAHVRLARPIAPFRRLLFSSFYEARLADPRSAFQREIDPAAWVDCGATFSALVLIQFVHRSLSPLGFTVPLSHLAPSFVGLSHEAVTAPGRPGRVRFLHFPTGISTGVPSFKPERTTGILSPNCPPQTGGNSACFGVLPVAQVINRLPFPC